MDEIIIIAEQKARCPRCKAIVARAVRQHDAQFVAACAPCGHPLIEGIEQPPVHRLTAAEIEALVTDSAPTSMPVAEDGRKNGRPPRERISADECVRMLEQIEDLLHESGLPSYKELSLALGMSVTRLNEIRNDLQRRDVTRQVADRLQILIERYRKDGDQRAKSGRGRASKAACQAMLTRLDEVRAELGLRTMADLALAMGRTPAWMSWFRSSLRACAVRQSTIERSERELAALIRQQAMPVRRQLDLEALDEPLRKQIELLIQAHRAGARVAIEVRQS